MIKTRAIFYFPIRNYPDLITKVHNMADVMLSEGKTDGIAYIHPVENTMVDPLVSDRTWINIDAANSWIMFVR